MFTYKPVSQCYEHEITESYNLRTQMNLREPINLYIINEETITGIVLS
jgi:hypothetical protein